MNLPFAETISYFKTSQSGVESWMNKIETLIEKNGGVIRSRLVGRNGDNEAILIAFSFKSDDFKLMYPVLPVKNPKDKTAAQRQCATLIYHDVKERVNRIKIFGARTVFMDFLVLPNGKTSAESQSLEIQEAIKGIKQLS